MDGFALNGIVRSQLKEGPMNEQEIKATIKTFILNEFLPGEDPAALTDTTELGYHWNPRFHRGA